MTKNVYFTSPTQDNPLEEGKVRVLSNNAQNARLRWEVDVPLDRLTITGGIVTIHDSESGFAERLEALPYTPVTFTYIEDKDVKKAIEGTDGHDEYKLVNIIVKHGLSEYFVEEAGNIGWEQKTPEDHDKANIEIKTEYGQPLKL